MTSRTVAEGCDFLSFRLAEGAVQKNMYFYVRFASIYDVTGRHSQATKIRSFVLKISKFTLKVSSSTRETRFSITIIAILL